MKQERGVPHLSSGWVIPDPSRREVKNIRTRTAGLPGMVDRSPSKWNFDEKVRLHAVTVSMKKSVETSVCDRLSCPRGL